LPSCVAPSSVKPVPWVPEPPVASPPIIRELVALIVMFPDGFAPRPVVAMTPLVEPVRPETSAIIITRSLADRLVVNVTVQAPDVAMRPWMTWQRNRAVACVARVVAIAEYGCCACRWR
jgi:hypothetical protein